MKLLEDIKFKIQNVLANGVLLCMLRAIPIKFIILYNNVNSIFKKYIWKYIANMYGSHENGICPQTMYILINILKIYITIM